MKNAASHRKWFFASRLAGQYFPSQPDRQFDPFAQPRPTPTFRAWLALLLVIVLLSSSIPPSVVRAQDGTDLPHKSYLPIASKSIPPSWLGPTGGSIINIVADRRNPAVLYAGSSGGGVYKSTNGGDSWTNSSQGLGTQSVYALAIDPTNSSILYAGSYKKGVYKSTDAGASWTRVGSGTVTESIVYTLEVNPGNPQLVYAGTRLSGTYNGNYVGYLYKSTDGGASWSSVFSVTNDWVYDIAINPNSPDTILAATHEHGLYRTTSYGGSGEWTHIDLGGGEYDKGRALAYDPRSGAKRAYYAAWHGDFFISSTNGADWAIVPDELGTTHVYPNGIEIRSSRPDSMYLAAHSSDIAGVLRSSNAGSSWSGAGLSGKNVYTVAAPSWTENLIAGTYLEGIFKSTNEGNNWYSAMSGVDNVQVTGVVVLNDSILYCSTISYGVMRSTDGGRSWTSFNNNLGASDVNGLAQDPSNPNILFALTTNAGLRRIDLSSSSSWSAIGIPAPAGLIAEGTPDRVPASPFARPEPLDELNALEGSGDIGAAGQLITAGAEGINTLAFAPSQTSKVYLGTNGAGVYTSSNGGTSWASTGLNGYTIRQVIVNPTNPANVYALTNETGRVWYSTNSGASWQALALPNAQLIAYSAAFWPGDASKLIFGTNTGAWLYAGTTWTAAGLAGETVYTLNTRSTPSIRFYAGTDTGAFYSTDGASWSRPVAELNLVRVQSITLHPSNICTLFFGTSARGILRACTP